MAYAVAFIVMGAWLVAAGYCFSRGLDALDPPARPTRLPRFWKARGCAWFIPGLGLVAVIIAAHVHSYNEREACRSKHHGVWVEGQCVTGDFEVVE